MRKLLFVGGARPNFMKLAPIMREVRERHSHAFHAVFVHTGQHYDDALSGRFLDHLGLPRPDYNLGVGSGSHAEQTAAVMVGFEQVCRQEQPDMVVVVGDVNSTLACTLVAAKSQIPVAHVEAGLRSFDRRMPEEVNRVATDALADLCLVTEQSGLDNLLAEGKPRDRVHLVGNLMIDTLVRQLRDLPETPPPCQKTYAVVTLHRPSNVDNSGRLAAIVAALDELAQTMPVYFPVHPRTRARLAGFGLEDGLARNVRLLPPLDYATFLALWKDAALVLTDSGGIQEETTFLGVPCLTLRENTERPITVEMGSNRLVPGGTRDILNAAHQALAAGRDAWGRPPLWDGRAAERIVGHFYGAFLTGTK